MDSFITAFFEASAWTMDTPRPYSLFHLVLAGMGISLAVLAAYKLPRKKIVLILFLCGLFLAASELYKQGFLYFVVNGRQYDWWYFPFQLCSVPMYLCLLLPAVKGIRKGRLSRIFYTFLQDYALLGGVMALAEPSGLMHPYWTLTLHGFIWHFILIFIGLFCALTGEGGKDCKSFLSSLPLFLLCCAIAMAVNLLSHPYGNADMFYISPYYPNKQLIFHEIALTIGTGAGNIFYLLSVVLGAAVCHWFAGKIHPH